MKVKKLMLLFLSLVLMASSFSQGIIRTKADCGQTVKLKFTQIKQINEIKIPCKANTKLSLTLIPTGDNLKFRVEIFDPAGGKFYPEKINDIGVLFNNEGRTFEVTTGVLDADGDYTIKVYNFCTWNYGRCKDASHAGEFSFSSTCSGD